MKRFVFFIALVFSFMTSVAQSYDTSRANLTNYLVRMYRSAPFTGVRIVDDYGKCYLISVLAMDRERYSDEGTMTRVATVKAASQASRYLNGAMLTSELIIKTSEYSDGESETEILELIKESSAGYVKALELLAQFSSDTSSDEVFIFCTEVETKKGKQR